MRHQVRKNWRTPLRRCGGLAVLSVFLLAGCGGMPESAANEDLGTTTSEIECGQQCQAICIWGCNSGYHYSWQQARCVADNIGCDDGYACDFGPCGGANERVCNTAGTGCWSCDGGMHFDAGTGRCQPPVPSGTCDDGFYYSLGPCGGAGQRECNLGSGCSACNSGLFFDGSGPCYNGLCLEVTDRCQPLPPPAPNVPPHSDLTFFIANDIHIFRGWGDATYQNNVWAMNNVNAAYPAGWPAGSLSPGPIAVPAGVIIAGDLTTCGDCAPATISRSEIWPFRDLYDQGRTPNSIAYPVYLGLGNHDYYPKYSYNTGNASSTSEKNNLMIAYQESRMNGQMGVTNYDENSHSYSWDWGNVHFVQANLFPGAANGGLSWLEQDLASHVGTSGRPVVVIQHYGWDDFSKEMTDSAGYTPDTRDKLEANYHCVKDVYGDIISCTDANGIALSWTWWSYDDRVSENLALAPYNVVAIFTGHAHNAPEHVHVPDAANPSGPGYDVYRGSSGGAPNDEGDTHAGGFLVVHMNDDGMDVMHLGWSYGAKNFWNPAESPAGAHVLTRTSSPQGVDHVWSKRYTPVSCKDYLARYPGTPSGVQMIDPDGPGGNPPMSAYCDMRTDGGGWTLITSTDGVSTWSQAASVAKGSSTYLPPDVVQRLAAVSSQVHIRSASVDPASQATPYHYITSLPGSLPITNLQHLVALNANVVTPSRVWTGDAQVIANQLWYTCLEPPYGATASSYPALHWACNNGNGLHVLPSISTWSAYYGPSEPMDVFVR